MEAVPALLPIDNGADTHRRRGGHHVDLARGEGMLHVQGSCEWRRGGILTSSWTGGNLKLGERSMLAAAFPPDFGRKQRGGGSSTSSKLENDRGGESLRGGKMSHAYGRGDLGMSHFPKSSRVDARRLVNLSLTSLLY